MYYASILCVYAYVNTCTSVHLYLHMFFFVMHPNKFLNEALQCISFQIAVSTGSPSSLCESHKQQNMALNYKGLNGIFYKISMEVVKSENS